MNILLLSVLAVLFFVSIVLASQNIFAQTEVEEINDNSLVACIDYFIDKQANFKANLTQQELEEKLKSNPYFDNENNVRLVAIPLCEFTYEHEGVYGHLLPEAMQEKYGKIVATKIVTSGYSDNLIEKEPEEEEQTYSVDDIIKESFKDPNTPSRVNDMNEYLYYSQLEK